MLRPHVAMCTEGLEILRPSCPTEPGPGPGTARGSRAPAALAEGAGSPETSANSREQGCAEEDALMEWLNAKYSGPTRSPRTEQVFAGVSLWS